MNIEEHITPGHILLLYISFPHEEVFRDKYFVVAGNSKYPLLLKLNTDDRQTEIAKRKKESCFRFKKSVYTKLDHDRFVDCGTPWERLISIDEILQQISKEPDRRIIGEVTPDHKREIIERTEKSKSFSAIQKRIVRDCLSVTKSPA